MPFRRAALSACTLLGLSPLIAASAHAADVPGQTAPMAEKTVSLPGGNAVSVWTDLWYIRTEDKRPFAFSRGRAWQSTTGIDYGVGRTLAVGGGISFTDARTTEFVIPGRTETDSVFGFVRATTYFLNNFNAGIIGGYGTGHTDGTRLFNGNLDVYSRDADAAFAGAHIGASFDFQGLFVNPAARILYSTSDFNPFLTSLGANAVGQRDEYTRASLGGDVGYRFQVGTFTVTPSVRAFFVYDLELPNGFTDRSALDLGAGLNVQSGGFSAGVEAFSTVGRSDLNNYAVRGFASYRF